MGMSISKVHDHIEQLREYDITRWNRLPLRLSLKVNRGYHQGTGCIDYITILMSMLRWV